MRRAPRPPSSSSGPRDRSRVTTSMPALLQPRGRRCKAEGLSAQVVGREEEDRSRLRWSIVALAEVDRSPAYSPTRSTTLLCAPVMVTFTCAFVQQHWNPPPPSPDRSFACDPDDVFAGRGERGVGRERAVLLELRPRFAERDVARAAELAQRDASPAAASAESASGRGRSPRHRSRSPMIVTGCADGAGEGGSDADRRARKHRPFGSNCRRGGSFFCAASRNGSTW